MVLVAPSSSRRTTPWRVKRVPFLEENSQEDEKEEHKKEQIIISILGE